MIGFRLSAVAGFAAATVLLAPTLAQAAQGVVVEDTPLFAGPSSQFPPIDQIQAGTGVGVNGCLTGYTWCDVSFQEDRGWISGQALEILFQSRRIRVVEATPTVVPFIGFEFGSYWQQHYQNRPFYHERDRYAGINININISGGKAGPASDGKNKNKFTNGGAGAGQVTVGGKTSGVTAGVSQAKIVTSGHKHIATKNNTAVGAGTLGSGKVIGAVPGKKRLVQPVVKKICKPGDNACAKGQGNGNSG